MKGNWPTQRQGILKWKNLLVGLGFFLFFLCDPLFAQMAVTFVRHYPAPGMTGGLASLAAPTGVAYITGQFDYGGCKTWVAAIDMCGNPLWVYLYGSGGGVSLGYVEGNRVAVGNNYSRVYLLDGATGNVIWGVNIGSGYYTPAVANDTALNRILVTVQGDPDAALIVLDYNSNLVWSRRYRVGVGSEEFHSILVLPDTTYVLCGWTSSSGAGNVDAYIVRITNQGNVIWARTLGGINFDGGQYPHARVDCSLSPDARHIVWAGHTRTQNFLVTNNSADLLLFVLDTMGNLQWARTYGATQLEVPKRVRYLHDKRIAVIGETGSNSWSSGTDDRAFLLITDSNGIMLTLRRYLYGGTETDAVGLDVFPDNTLALSLYGQFGGTGEDALLVRTDNTGYVPCGMDTLQWQSVNITNLISVNTPAVSVQNGPTTSIINVPRTTPNLNDNFLCITCMNLDTPKITLAPADTICAGDTISIAFSVDTTTQGCFVKTIDGQWVFEDTVRIDTFSVGMHIVVASVQCASTTLTTQDTFWVMPSPQITNPDTYACQNDSLFLSLQVTNGTPPYSSYQWQPQNLIACDTCPATWIYVPQSTSLVVTVTDQIGCQATDTIFIEAKPLPSTSTSSNSPVCMGDTLLLSASAQNAQPPYNYTYYTPWGDSLPGPNLTLSPADTSWTGTWTLIVSDSFGCKDTVLIPIRITPLPILSFSGDTALCLGDTGKLSVTIASGTPPFQINWSGANWFSCNHCDSTRWFSTSSTTFQVIVSDSIGCKDTLSIPITIYPLPIFDLPDTVICYYDSAFRFVPTGIAWQWQPAQWTNCDTCQATWLTPPAQPTTFWVTATSPQGCQWTDTFHIDIDYGEPVQIVRCPSAVLADSQARLYGIAEGINWWWTSPDGTILTSPSQQMIWVRVPSTHGEQDTFVFWTESVLGCLTADTCIVGAVKVQCWDDVWVPNTFTPNGDDKNDVLYVYAINPVRILRWRIYDRWGNLVFAADDFRAGYPLQHSEVGWDGTIHGQPARSDVYVWWLEIQCGRYVVFRKGDVTLIR